MKKRNMGNKGRTRKEETKPLEIAGLCNMGSLERSCAETTPMRKGNEEKPWQQIAANLFRRHYCGYGALIHGRAVTKI